MKTRFFYLIVICLSLTVFAASAEKNFLTAGTPAAKELDQKITINFDKVSLKTIIKFISEQTGKNFMIDDAVRGAVTVISPTKITVGEALQVLTSILDAKGFTLVPSGQIIKIIPKKEARQSVIDTYVGSVPPQAQTTDIVVTQIVPLEYAKAEDVRKLLVPFISRDSNLLSYAPTNSLVVTDTAGNIARLFDMIKAVDVPGLETDTRIIFLKYADAKQLAAKLLSVVKDVKKKNVPLRRNRKNPHKSAGNSAGAANIKIIADERTNALIVVSDKETIDLIEKLIVKLDREIPGGRDNLHVIYLKNTSAEQLANVLNDIKAKKNQASSVSKAPIRRTFTAARATKSLIVADKSTNALIITASPEEFATYKKVIDMLDIPRRQVFVEALIAEVKLNNLDKMGLDWNTLTEPEKDELAPFGITNYGLNAEAMTGSLLGFSGGLYKGGEEGSLPSIGAIINLYGKDQNFNILSTPHLVTTDNQEAEIIVGSTVPFLKSSRVTESDTVVKTFDYEDVGITLRITPHVTDDDKVRLEIYQKITAILDGGSLEAPTTTKREARTTVTVQNRQTIAIGGLVSNDRSLIVHKIPILGDIPFLKYLFSRNQWQEQKTNLLIFITPTVIKEPEALQVISREKDTEQKQFIKDFAPRYLQNEEKEKVVN